MNLSRITPAAPITIVATSSVVSPEPANYTFAEQSGSGGKAATMPFPLSRYNPGFSMIGT